MGFTDYPFNMKGYICLEFSGSSGAWPVCWWWTWSTLIPDGIRRIPLPRASGRRSPSWRCWFDAGSLLWELKLPSRFRAITEMEKALTAVSDAMGEKLIYEPMERGKERREAFAQSHPGLAEKTREAGPGALARRSDQRRT